jgi:hypothetical protein
MPRLHEVSVATLTEGGPNLFPFRPRPFCRNQQPLNNQIGNGNDVLTIAEVAAILRCSKNHVSNVLNGKVAGLPTLTHFVMGRRKLVRREWLSEWMERHKKRC